MAKRERKQVHKIIMTEGKRNIIQQLLQEYDIETYAINYYVYLPYKKHPFFPIELELLLFYQERMFFQLFNFYLAPA